MSSFWFLSFADSRMKGPLRRIRRQAEAMGVFGDRIRVWTEFNLDADFRERMKQHLIPGSRGYGYWCWKPQVVLQLFREMAEGDVLLFADAGCHLNPGGVDRLMEYFHLAEKYGLVAFQAKSRDCPVRHFLIEREWTKGDLLDYYGVRGNRAVLETGQLGGGIFLARKRPDSIAFFQEFLRPFQERFSLCDDSPSISPNLPGFRENRHDQSVFSILGKQHGVFALSTLEYDPMNGGDDWSSMGAYPVWAKHDKGGLRGMFPNWLKRIVHRVSCGRI